jgi:predicted amidohydrolase YtcJ
VAIKEGRLVAVGSDSQVLALAGANTERIDLHRRGRGAGSPESGRRFTQGPGRVEQLEENRWPTRWDLDLVSPDNPILINRIAADYVWITNSPGLAAAVTGHVIPYGITTDANPLTTSNNQPTQHADQQLMQRGKGVPARVRLPVRSQSIEANLDLVRGLLYSPPFQSDFLQVGTFKISLDKGRPGRQVKVLFRQMLSGLYPKVTASP